MSEGLAERLMAGASKLRGPFKLDWPGEPEPIDVYAYPAKVEDADVIIEAIRADRTATVCIETIVRRARDKDGNRMVKKVEEQMARDNWPVNLRLYAQCMAVNDDLGLFSKPEELKEAGEDSAVTEN